MATPHTYRISSWILKLGISCLVYCLLYLIIPAPSEFKTANISPYQGLDTATIHLLNAWYPGIINPDGGYYTNFRHDWSRPQNQNKMLVTQARGLWTAARAAQSLPNQESYKEYARHGFRFLVDSMWDQKSGGFYLNFPMAEASHAHKLIYGNSFALYALAEYYKIQPTQEVKDWIVKTFEWMEDVAHDEEHKGYFNQVVLNAEGNVIRHEGQTVKMGGWGEPMWKDQNTSIHLLEAFTNVYLVWPDPKVKTRLEEMLYLVRDVMVSKDGYLYLNFTQDWTPISHRDSSEEFIIKNISLDHVSFGHNIETAFLLLEAAKALYSRMDEPTLHTAKQLIDHTLDNGFDRQIYGLFDKGYYFKNEDSLRILDRQKVWWSQAEAFHALDLIQEYFPDDERYKLGSQAMWKYITENLIDYSNGGWYPNGIDNDPEAMTKPKASAWKGAYHDGRCLMNLYDKYY